MYTGARVIVQFFAKYEFWGELIKVLFRIKKEESAESDQSEEGEEGGSMRKGERRKSFKEKIRSKEERMLSNIKENNFIDQEDIDNIIDECKKSKRIKFRAKDYFWGNIIKVFTLFKVDIKTLCRFTPESRRRTHIYRRSQQLILQSLDIESLLRQV